jgi:transcriptional regulator with XRE-family HTH domain
MARPKRLGAPRPYLGAKLQALRESFGFTEKEFALALDCSRPLVLKYEGRMKGQEDAIASPAYIRKVNDLKRKLKAGLTKAEVLVADNGKADHVVTDAFVAKNNAKLRRCKRSRCQVPFLTAVHNQIFCSRECRMLHGKGR